MSQHSDIDIDPITFEVMRSIFEFASDRMATVLQRSSFLPILADMLDFSNAIYDADLQLLSQAANCPVHLAAMKFSAEEAVKGVGPQNVHEGDVQAHLGALLAAEQELQRACDRYGVDVVQAAMKKIQAYTERMVRESIRTIPNGTYEAEDYADTDGITQSRVKVKVRLEIGDDSIKVDFTGTDPICQGAISSSKANTMSAVLYSLQFFLAPDAPQNQGLFNPIKVILPEGCWLNATWPAPTIGCTTLTASKITSAIWQALAKAIPERVTGSTCADANWFVASCVDKDGKTDVFSDLPAGGWGGTPYSDGMNVTMDPLGNCMNMAAEAAELFFPIAYEAFELRQDSAGAGRYRGGLGSVFKVRFFGGGELGMETSRTLAGSPGAAGGLASAVQRSSHIRADGTSQVIGGIDDDGNWQNPLLASHKFDPGETFMFESTGGGWGDPRQRAVQDVLDEYVSIGAAKELYGVVIDPATLTVDEAATAALRDRMRRRSRGGMRDPRGSRQCGAGMRRGRSVLLTGSGGLFPPTGPFPFIETGDVESAAWQRREKWIADRFGVVAVTVKSIDLRLSNAGRRRKAAVAVTPRIWPGSISST